MNIIRKLFYMLKMGGLDLLLFKLEDKIFKTDSAIQFRAKLFKAAETAGSEELARLVSLDYTISTGKQINIEHPVTFNEKIQWIKIYDATPLKTRLADKYLVREWIKEVIGEKYLVPLLGVWNGFDEISFDDLPDSFALKCNHGSGWNLVVRNKTNIDMGEVKKVFDRWMTSNFAYYFGEMQYRDIPPKIIAEKYMDNLICEYQYWCFNGKPRFISCIKEPHGKNEKLSYSLKFELLDFVTSYPAADKCFYKPDFLEEMNAIARKMCRGFTFVRVDFMSDGQKVFFSEMTFTPANGKVSWKPEKYDEIIGGWLIIPDDNKK